MRFQAVVFGMALFAAVASTQAQEKPTYKIGIVTATTGSASVIAAPANNAIALYEEQLAAQKDLPFNVQFIKYDDASDPTKSVNSVRKLIQDDKVDIVICCTTTPSSLAIAKTVEDAKVTAVSMSAGAAVVEPVAEKRFMFKTPITDRLMINYTLDVMKKKGIKTVAFMGLDDAYGEGAWVEFKPLAEKNGIKVVANERFARGDTNFAPQALRVKGSSPDAVYIHAIPPSSALVNEALKRVGFKGPIYHGAGSPTSSFLAIGKQSVEGAIVGATPITVYKELPKDNPLVPVITTFVTAYDAKYGQGKAEIFATQGYDAVGLSINALKRYTASGKKGDLAQRRVDIRNVMEDTRNYVGTVGIFNYSATDHVGLDERTLFLVQVKNGQFTLLKD
ncbi:ABC transporter substrate-binding protein [Burkholderia anthina]|uniref:ABC transporter substrate-binding protein n=1 Tax=Burkholderia anthina TaxID=179879 RepID=UPI00158A4042|nr:ABC transporter substrate-binding protein [Burkholderia anthina]